jgi:hypothetical protein
LGRLIGHVVLSFHPVSQGSKEIICSLLFFQSIQQFGGIQRQSLRLTIQRANVPTFKRQKR